MPGSKCKCGFCVDELKQSCLSPGFCQPCGTAADRTLDCAGLFCPLPVANARIELDKMQPGQVLEIIADDPGFEKDLPAWCQASGQEFLEMRRDGALFKGYVRKK